MQPVLLGMRVGVCAAPQPELSQRYSRQLWKISIRFALIIPAFDEEECVGAVVSGFRRVTDAEIVVVDNASSSDSKSVLLNVRVAVVVAILLFFYYSFTYYFIFIHYL